mmetsp:Transcript_25011/g.18870  ORF Transcript_25011/g.18870 Transcript_25011/m.18870 type:complete len:84 (-) Transcript_25011:687-938(-)
MVLLKVREKNLLPSIWSVVLIFALISDCLAFDCDRLHSANTDKEAYALIEEALKILPENTLIDEECLHLLMKRNFFESSIYLI